MSYPVFISYSRSDSDVADRIADLLSDAGFNVQIDRRGLHYGEEWQSELDALIRSSPAAIWLVSPASMSSQYCLWELGLLESLCRKIIPVVISPSDLWALPEHLGKRHVLPAVGVFDEGQHLQSLIDALRTDAAWLRQNQTYHAAAERWLNAGRKREFLLRGVAIRQAENWLNERPPSVDQPPSIVVDFVYQSRALSRRNRLVGLSVAAAITVAAFAGLFVLREEQATAALAAERERSATNLRYLAESFRAESQLAAVGQREDLTVPMREGLAALPGLDAEDPFPFSPTLLGTMISRLSDLQMEPRLPLGHSAEVSTLALSDDERLVASGDVEGDVLVQDVLTGRSLRTSIGAGPVVGLEFLPNNLLAASGIAGDVLVIDTEDLTEVARTGLDLPLVGLRGLDEDHIATLGRDGTAVVLLSKDLSQIARLDHFEEEYLEPTDEDALGPNRVLGEDGDVYSNFTVGFQRPEWFSRVGIGVTDIVAHRGGWLTAGEDGRLVSWSEDGRKRRAVTVGPGAIYDMVYMPDYDALALATNRLIEFLNAEDLARLGSVIKFDEMRTYSDGTLPPIIAIEETPDPRFIAGLSQAWQETQGRLFVWQVGNGEPYTPIPSSGTEPQHEVKFAKRDWITVGAVGSRHRDIPGTSLNSGPEENYVLWSRLNADSIDFWPLYGHGAAVTRVATGRQGMRFASADAEGTVRTWALAPRQHRVIDQAVGAEPLDFIAEVHLAADGTTGIARTLQGSVGRVDVSDNDPFGSWTPFRYGGTVVEAVVGAPAQAAEFKPGDVITAVNGEAVSEAAELIGLISAQAGKQVQVDVLRDRKPMRLTVTPEAQLNSEGETVGRMGVQLGHAKATAIAFDGSSVLIATEDGAMRRFADGQSEESELFARFPNPVTQIVVAQGVAAATTGSDVYVLNDGSSEPAALALPENWKQVDVADISVSGDVLLVNRFSQEVAVSRDGQVMGAWTIDDLDAMSSFATFPARFTPDGTKVILPVGPSGPGIKVLDLAEPQSQPKHIALSKATLVRAITAFEDNTRVAVALNDNRIYIVDIITGESLSFPSYYRTPNQLALVENDTLLISATAEIVDIFDVQTGELLLVSGEDLEPFLMEGMVVPSVGAVAVSADGSSVATSHYNRLLVYKFPLSLESVVQAVCARLPKELVNRSGDGDELTALISCDQLP